MCAFGCGVGFWVISDWLDMVPQLEPVVAVFLWSGLLVMPAGATLALAPWILPLPHGRAVEGPACVHRRACRGCRRTGER